MHLCSWILAVCLVGQIDRIPDPPFAVQPPATERPTIGGTSIAAIPAKNSTRATSDQLVADALALPTDGAITGRPISLLSAVAAVPDRARQLEAVHAYWRLVQAIGDYRYCHERQQRLARLKAAGTETAGTEAPDLRTAQAIAVAQLHDAELQATSAQQDLAAKLDFPETAPLPLPADRPLTEAYRTRFTELFAGRKTPDRVRMLDQTLPLRQRAVESHAAAVIAAEEGLDAAIELQAGGQARPAGALHALEAQVREQRAFIAAVCRYNDDIVDYSLAVVPLQTSASVLVSTLIKQARPIAAAASDSATIPAQFQQAMTVPGVGVPASAGSPLQNRLKAELQPPALIAPPSAVPAIPNPPQPLLQAPAVAAPAAQQPSPPAAPGEAPAAPAAPQQIHEDQAPSLAPPQELTIPQTPPQADGAKQPAVDGKSLAAGTIRSTFKPVVENEPRDNAARLAAALFTDSSNVQLAGQPLPLVDCLRSAAPNHRLDAIIAYWKARREAAMVQLFAAEKEWLDGLKPALAAQNPPSPTGMLNLRAAQSATDAQLADAQADFLAASFELVTTVGLASDKGPPRPSSIPFAGHFPLPLRERAGERVVSRPLRQLELEITSREKTANDHAAAVVASEVARTTTTADYLAGRTPVEHVLNTIEVQANETLALINELGDYNKVIARYVTGGNGRNDSAENLSAKLMIAL